jgi:hypothetical protein
MKVGRYAMFAWCFPSGKNPVHTPIYWADRGKANTHLMFVL